MAGFIYKLTCTVTGKSYIGFTKNPKARWKRHMYRARLPEQTTVLHRAIAKHGWEAFLAELIYCSKDEEYCASVMEPYFIRLHGTLLPAGYNMTTGGERPDRRIVLASTRAKLRQAALGKTPSEETRRIMQEGAKARGVSQELLDRLHAGNVGSKRTKETRIRMSEAAKTQTPSPAYNQMVARARPYTITDPDGRVEYTPSLRQWEKAQGVSRNLFSRQARLRPGIPFGKGRWLGWTIAPYVCSDQVKAGVLEF